MSDKTENHIMDIEIHKYDAKPQYIIDEYPSWDGDSWAAPPDQYELHRSEREPIFVVVYPGDPPIYGVGGCPTEAFERFWSEFEGSTDSQTLS